jgi:hypothetical protein
MAWLGMKETCSAAIPLKQQKQPVCAMRAIRSPAYSASASGNTSAIRENKFKRLADQLAFCSTRVFCTFFWQVSCYQFSEPSIVRSDSHYLDAVLFLSIGAHAPH